MPRLSEPSIGGNFSLDEAVVAGTRPRLVLYLIVKFRH